jgi:S1-C subfamily serine protease
MKFSFGRSLPCLSLVVSSLLIFTGSRVLSQTGSSVPAMLERVLPAVVTVGVSEVQTAKRAFGYGGNASDAAYQRVLDLTGVKSSGSGFIIERSGRKYIVTNAHVVEEAGGERSIAVYSINQTKYPVRVIGGDSFYDLALLEFTERQPGAEFSVLEFASGEPRLGDQVFAVGNPLGEFPYTVTQGIIGAKNRAFGGLTAKFGYLQSTATVIWGNSGGPLVNSEGNVVGVNSRIEIRKIGEQNYVQPQLNFALETKIARRIVDDILANNGRVRRSYLGVEICQRFRVDGQGQETKLDQGPVISALIPGGPASRTLEGKAGARILQINGVAVRNVEEALGALEEVLPGNDVQFDLEKSGTRERVTVRTEEMTSQVLGSLAKAVIQRHGQTEVVEGEGRVALRGGSREEVRPGQQPRDERLNVRGQSYEYEKQSRQFRKSNQASGGTVNVAAAGVVVNENEANVWRVRTLSDLGVAIRLSALAGVIDLVTDMPEGTNVLRMSMADEEGTFAPTAIH